MIVFLLALAVISSVASPGDASFAFPFSLLVVTLEEPIEVRFRFSVVVEVGSGVPLPPLVGWSVWEEMREKMRIRGKTVLTIFSACQFEPGVTGVAFFIPCRFAASRCEMGENQKCVFF